LSSSTAHRKGLAPYSYFNSSSVSHALLRAIRLHRVIWRALNGDWRATITRRALAGSRSPTAHHCRREGQVHARQLVLSTSNSTGLMTRKEVLAMRDTWSWASPPAAVQARSGTDRPPTATLAAGGTTSAAAPAARTTASWPAIPDAGDAEGRDPSFASYPWGRTSHGRRAGSHPKRRPREDHQRNGKTRAEGRQDQRHAGQHGQQPQPRVHLPGFAGGTGHGVTITGRSPSTLSPSRGDRPSAEPCRVRTAIQLAISA